MKTTLFDRFLTYLRSTGYSSDHEPKPVRPTVTISREEGAGAAAVAELLVSCLEGHLEPASPWVIVDRDLADQVLKDRGLAKEMEPFITEDTAPIFKDAMEAVLGLHPARETLVKHTACTIAKLARRGNAIIIGRAANIITAGFQNVLHVRLICPITVRISRISQELSLTNEEAHKYVETVDRRRARYVRQYYAADMKDPLGYHLVLNTGKLGYRTAARLIADAVIRMVASETHELKAALI